MATASPHGDQKPERPNTAEHAPNTISVQHAPQEYKDKQQKAGA